MTVRPRSAARKTIIEDAPPAAAAAPPQAAASVSPPGRGHLQVAPPTALRPQRAGWVIGSVIVLSLSALFWFSVVSVLMHLARLLAGLLW